MLGHVRGPLLQNALIFTLLETVPTLKWYCVAHPFKSLSHEGGSTLNC